ncbi:hypothetical protein LTS15_010566 [Exophiala xenobiotica]|nr:hypothetical protein LTS15_010566 [Exophiala xenobiotica]
MSRPRLASRSPGFWPRTGFNNGGHPLSTATRPTMAQDHNDNTVVLNPAASLKRPLPDGERRSRDAVKRRSSRACRTCRARKVRCDITIHGSPCTNCRLDNIDCVLLVSKRGSKARSNSADPAHYANTDAISRPQQQRLQDRRKSQQVQSRPELSYQHHPRYGQEEEEEEEENDNEEQEVPPMTPILSSCELGAAAVPQSEPAQTSSSASNPPTGKIYEVAVGLTFDHEEDDGEGNDDENASDGVGQNTPTLHATSCSHAGSSLGSASSAARVDSPLSLVNGSLPSFIHPLTKTLAEDDLEFLERKGAFTMPESEIRDEILRSYVSTVHPFMPILDLSAFLTAVTNNTKGNRISLLLFQAVMFAGLSALDPQLIQRMGFKTTKDARQVFFSRVRLLHDLDVESDDKSMLQALLLMSLWYGGRNEQRNTWYYTGLALSLALNMGLHRGPDDTHPERHLRRRLWWSLYIRDRLIALGTRRPMRIRDDDYEVFMLSQEDFDCEPLDESLAPFFDGGRSVEDMDQQTYLPLMCIELAKLCICIGHVLTSQYTTLGRRSLWTKALMVVPKQDLEQSEAALELERHDRELADWYQGLHPDVSKVARSSASEGSSYNCTQWHWTIVDMLRLTLISLLHRPQSLRLFPTNVANSTTSTTDLLKASRTKLKATARELTRLAHRMLHHDQIRYLPTSGVPALLSASLTHMLDLEAQDDDVQDASIYRFDQIMQVLKELRGIYASADSAINYLGMVIRKTGISDRVSQVAAIAPEFRCTTPPGKRNSIAAMAIESHHQRRDSTALKKTTTAILPCPNGLSQPDGNAAIHTFPLPGAIISATDMHVAQQAMLRPNQDDQNANFQVRQSPLSAKTLNLAESDLGPVSEAQNFGTSSLHGGDTITVEIQGGGGDRLDQQSMLAHDTLFGPLRSLDYDIDPELFDAQFNFYTDEFFGQDYNRR